MTGRWKALVAFLAALALLAAACGSDAADVVDGALDAADEAVDDAADAAEDAVDDAMEDEDTGSEEPAPAGESILDGAISCEQQHEGKSVSIFSPVRDSENDAPIADFVGAYQPLVDCTGVEIVWQGTDQFETEINVRLQGGDPPDVIDYPQPGLLAGHVAQGFVYPFPDDLAAQASNDFIDGWSNYGTFGDGVYAIPGRSNVKSMVWYSPSTFAEGGYEIPETLEELTALSDQMVADGSVPWCIGAESGVATGWVLTDWMEDFMMRINGGEAYDQWISNDLAFNDPAVIEVVDAVGAFVKNPDYLGGENNVKAIATTKFQDGGHGVVSGDCHMHRQASFYSGLWPEGTTVGADGDVWFFYLPSPAGGPKYVLGGGDVYAAATDKPETFDVLRYTGSAEYQLQIVNARGELSPHLDIPLAEIDDEFVQAVSELQASADVFRFDASDLMPGAVGAGTFWTEVTNWVIGGDTQTFVDNVQNSWPS